MVFESTTKHTKGIFVYKNKQANRRVPRGVSELGQHRNTSSRNFLNIDNPESTIISKYMGLIVLSCLYREFSF